VAAMAELQQALCRLATLGYGVVAVETRWQPPAQGQGQGGPGLGGGRPGLPPPWPPIDLDARYMMQTLVRLQLSTQGRASLR
jgi:hypothetical protein